MALVKVAEKDALQPGDRIVVEINDRLYIAVFRVGDDFFAIEDVCTHDDGPLGDGDLDGYEVECPRHGARFDIRTGEVRSMPAIRPVQRFDVKVDGNDVLVEVGDL